MIPDKLHDSCIRIWALGHWLALAGPGWYQPEPATSDSEPAGELGVGRQITHRHDMIFQKSFLLLELGKWRLKDVNAPSLIQGTSQDQPELISPLMLKYVCKNQVIYQESFICPQTSVSKQYNH